MEILPDSDLERFILEEPVMNERNNSAALEVEALAKCLFCNSLKECAMLANLDNADTPDVFIRAATFLGSASLKECLETCVLCVDCTRDVVRAQELEHCLEDLIAQRNFLKYKISRKLRTTIVATNSAVSESSNDLASHRLRIWEGVKTARADLEPALKTDTSDHAESKDGTEYLIHDSNVVTVKAYLKDNGTSSSSSDDSSDNDEDSSSSDNDAQLTNKSKQRVEVKRNVAIRSKGRPLQRPRDSTTLDPAYEELKKKYKLKEFSIRLERCDENQGENGSSRMVSVNAVRSRSSSPTSLLRCIDPLCKKRFATPMQRNGHIIGKHLGVGNPFICDDCPMRFPTCKLLKIHLEVHKNVDNLPLQCPDCSARFATADMLADHARYHGITPSVQVFTCGYDGCNKLFTDSSRLEVHMQRVHQGCKRPYRCDRCTQSFREISELQDHQNIHLNINPYVCPVCDKRFATKIRLKTHRQNNHDKRLPCPYCPEKFDNQDDKRSHIATHPEYQEQAPEVCKYCPARFASAGRLRKHLSEVHPEQCPEFPTCEVCLKTFKSRSTLRDHMYLHKRSYKYLCHLCSFGTFKESRLAEHIESHDDTKKFLCEECAKSFKTKSSLNRHKRDQHGMKLLISDVDVADS